MKKGKILFVNLTTKSTKTEILDEETYRKYPGGSALGMYLMLKNMDPKVDAYSPENLLIFSVSPLTGIPISGQSRMNVTTKSPLTGTCGDSQVGGYIPAALKGNGYDAVVISGISETPTYLYINEEHVELRDASNLWGKITGDTEDGIAEDLGHNKFEASVIGPGGENLVKYAAIMHQRSRANGRNGVGAVMGSKKLKAFVVQKKPPCKAVDPDGMKLLTKNVRERMAANPTIEGLAAYGSADTVEGNGGEGFLPSYNWNAGTLENWEETGGVAIKEGALKERETCFACAIRCKAAVEIEGKADPEYGGPEYETCATFGSYCGSTNLADICEANQLCNMYGLDTISCGATIAWAMDCYENGILKKEDLDGIELNFGNSAAFAPLIKKIALREEGVGNLLAEGSYRAAEKFGKEALDLVVACKKQEWPAHMVQMKPNLIVNYAVNPFGADHQSSEHDPALMAPDDDQNWIWPSMLESFEKCDEYGVLNENKAKFAYTTQKFYSVMDTLCLCQFAWGPSWQLYGPGDLLDFCKYGIGWDATIEELQEIGERRIVMMRLFNNANGITRADDTVPKKAFLPIKYNDGEVAQLKEEDFKEALDAYYQYAGWDVTTGIPTEATVKKLGLDWI